ncbi:MAG: dual specificity protein phosphatase family protein [Candidatus Riflebacteria bacterium]|nr:dual specificity protein phosphatase family protein [Candidatus Riflebacteria bacterium]
MSPVARENSLRFGWVLPGLLAGCRRPDEPSDYDLLVRQGVRTLVSLLEVPRLPGFAGRFELRHAHIPILDGSPPQVSQLDEFIDVVRTRGPACVHCLAGIGRTGCMLTGFLSRARGLAPAEAIRQVEGLRGYAFQTWQQEMWIYSLTPRMLEAE